jgi:predicted TIM-barrel fold metal-dependent hydrolase
LWREAETARVPIMLTVETEQLALIDAIASRHPGLKFALDHLCMPGGSKDGDAFAGIEALLALARCPNISVKATSLPMHTTDEYPYRRLHPYLRRIYEAYGPRRMFWGSDLTKLPCSYRQVVTMFTEQMPWLKTDDLEWIMGRALCEWLDWRL